MTNKKKNSAKKRFIRSGLVFIALMTIVTGLMPLILKGDLFYTNWWGGLVFTPLVVLVGTFFLYIVLFKYDKVNKTK